MALFTSVQSGSWNDTNTWDIAGFPALGDTVNIATSHIVTVTANAGVGTGGATGTDELTIIGTLVVGAFTLTVDGDTQINNGTLQLNAGATVSIDGTYEIEYTGTATLDINGTSGNRCEISAIAANNTWLDGAASASIINIDADYCDFIRFGDGSNRSFDFNGLSATQTINFQNCLFKDFTRYDAYQAARPNTDSQLKFINCDFRGMPSSNTFVIGDGSLWNFDANTHEFTNCTFYGNTSGSIVFIRLGNGSNKYIMTGNNYVNCEVKINNNHDTDGGFHFMDSGLQTSYRPQNQALLATYQNIIAWGDVSNPHFIACENAGEKLIKNCYFETPQVNTNHILPSEVNSSNTVTVENCIGVGGNFGIMRGTGTPTVEFRRNTHVTTATTEDAMFLIESPGWVNGIGTFVSNLHVSLSPDDEILFDDLIPASGGLVASNVLDYNCIYDHSLTGRYNVVVAGKTVGDVGFGASDIREDPQFNNGTASLQSWDTSLGGAGTINNVIAETMKLNGHDINGDPASFDTNYNYTDALAYFVDAYTPNNTALKGAGDGGEDIGAVNVAVAVSGSAGINVGNSSVRIGVLRVGATGVKIN